mgnify:CR=1 FL=1
MEKIIKEGKSVEAALSALMEENNLSKEEFLYTSNVKKGKLFQGTIYEVTAYLKTDINNEIKEFLRNVVENMGLDVTMELTNKDDRVTIRMFSNKDYILIGKEGATLKALETLAKQYIQNTTGIYYKFNLDVSNYKEKNIFAQINLKTQKDTYEKYTFFFQTFGIIRCAPRIRPLFSCCIRPSHALIGTDSQCGVAQ